MTGKKLLANVARAVMLLLVAGGAAAYMISFNQPPLMSRGSALSPQGSTVNLLFDGFSKPWNVDKYFERSSTSVPYPTMKKRFALYQERLGRSIEVIGFRQTHEEVSRAGTLLFTTFESDVDFERGRGRVELQVTPASSNALYSTHSPRYGNQSWQVHDIKITSNLLD